MHESASNFNLQLGELKNKLARGRTDATVRPTSNDGQTQPTAHHVPFFCFVAIERVLVSKMTDPTDAEMEAKMETARAKAEARRQRILTKQRERMGVVSGGTEGQTGGDAGSAGDAGAASAAAAAEGMASPSDGMSKYAAARRRRYGNKKAAAAPAPAASAEESSTPVETEAPAPAAAAETSESKTENEEPAAATASDTETTKDTKKYMGVAKMRRKMIAEKKKKEEAEAGSSSSASSASGRKLAPRSMSSVAKESVRQHRAAVLMQLFTLVLLFLAGLGVGMQNHALNDGVVVVNDQLSHTENGIGALRILGLGKATKSASDDARDSLLEKEEDANVVEGKNGADTETEGDEFDEDVAAAADGADAKPKAVGGDDKVPNIDPLFRVDLDELTAGPGFMNVAARLAVKVHRSIMYLLLVLPLSIIKSIFALPAALMTNPPILFLLSVVIRYVGRDLLGARLPDLDTVQGNASEDKGKDLIGSAKSMATNFLSSSFPAAAKLLEVFQDAKQDMFVILCGFFVGMILPIHLGKEAGKDEL